MKIEKTGFVQSRESVEKYFSWRVHRATPAVDKVNEFYSLKGKHVLEIGCGFGALSYVLSQKSEHVTAIEVDEKKLDTARKLLKDLKNVKLMKVVDEKLPFEKETFDAVFLFDVIEHIDRPDVTISECNRVLKQNGLLYVEFTPYYSITGHHLYDFAKWPIHVLPKHWIKRIVYGKNVKSFLTADDYWKQFESLNKLRISRFQKMVRSFKKRYERFIVKYPEVLEIDIPALNLLGPFKDFFTMSFEGLYTKK